MKSSCSARLTGSRQGYEWLRDLVGTPEFADRVDDIVLDVGLRNFEFSLRAARGVNHGGSALQAHQAGPAYDSSGDLRAARSQHLAHHFRYQNLRRSTEAFCSVAAAGNRGSQRQLGWRYAGLRRRVPWQIANTGRGCGCVVIYRALKAGVDRAFCAAIGTGRHRLGQRIRPSPDDNQRKAFNGRSERREKKGKSGTVTFAASAPPAQPCRYRSERLSRARESPLPPLL